MTASPEQWKNRLFYGDNLDILGRYVDDESVDLIYLDPPFKSNADYNILFREKDGSKAASQLRAFEDTWEWNAETCRAYFQFVESAETKASRALQSLRLIVGDSDMLAYLSMMAPRLVELRRVLKPTGSIYLHCDPTASHYLKLLMDGVFGAPFFRNEIIWKRNSAHSDAKQGAKHYGRLTDTIFFYSKTGNVTWNQTYRPYDDSYVQRDYRRVDSDGRRYRLDNIQGPGGAEKGNPYYEVMGVSRHWRYSRKKMQELLSEGRIVQTRPGAVPQYKRYLDEMPGVAVQNLWDDVPVINNRSKEVEGYPTQKPLALLERIITVSSNEGDLVLDPFCGCGTAIEAAQKLNRRWIGIDVTQPAMVVIKRRLKRLKTTNYEVIGEPVSLPDAQALAEQDPYQFQWWALGLVGARPADQKKGADRGIDGRLLFHDGRNETKEIIFSVKAGKLHASYVRDLRGVVEREDAQIGVLISFEAPTKQMIAEAASAGVYISPWGRKPYPKLQLLTVAELMSGVPVKRPGWETGEDRTFRKGPVSEPSRRREKQPRLFS